MPSSTTINAVGVILLVLSPIIGGVLSSAISYQKSFTLVINGFAGGMLLGMGLLHMLNEAVHGYPVQDDEVEYPYPYLITGCMVLFMFMLTNFIPIGVEMTLRSQSSSVLVDKVNITAISFFFGLAVHGIFEGYDAYSMRLILNLLQ
jgi:zinc transporter ZupT